MDMTRAGGEGGMGGRLLCVALTTVQRSLSVGSTTRLSLGGMCALNCTRAQS